MREMNGASSALDCANVLHPNSIKGGKMSIRLIRTFYLALLAITVSAGSAWAAEPDPLVLSYKLPADLKWSESVSVSPRPY